MCETTIDITRELADKIIQSATIFWEMIEINTLTQQDQPHDASGDTTRRYERYGIFRRTTDGTHWRLGWVDDANGNLVTVSSNKELVTLRRVQKIITTTWEEI